MIVDLLEVSEEDLAVVSALTASVFNRVSHPRDTARLRWMLFANPDADEHIPKGWVLRSRGETVGFLGNVLRRLSFCGKDHVIAFTSDFVVTPEYRFHGLKLAKAFFDQGQLDYVACSTGNRNSIPVLRRLGACQIAGADEAALFVLNPAAIASYYLEKKAHGSAFAHAVLPRVLGAASWFKRRLWAESEGSHAIEVRGVARFDDDVDDLYERSHPPDKVTSCRDSMRLNWLFVDGPIDRPCTKIRSAYRDGKLCGYVVTQDRKLGKARLEYRGVRDVFCALDDRLTFAALARHLVQECLEDGMDCLEFENIPAVLISQLASHGAWRRRLAVNPFLLCSKGEDATLLPEKAEMWYLVNSDGDGGGWQ